MPTMDTAERRTTEPRNRHTRVINPPPVGIEVAVFSHTGGPP
jgi:hypothetical protein